MVAAYVWEHLIQLSFLKLLLSYPASLLLTRLSLSLALSPHTHTLSLLGPPPAELFYHPSRAEKKIGLVTLAYLYTHLAHRGGGAGPHPHPPPRRGRGGGGGCALTGEVVVGVKGGGGGARNREEFRGRCRVLLNFLVLFRLLSLPSPPLFFLSSLSCSHTISPSYFLTFKRATGSEQTGGSPMTRVSFSRADQELLLLLSHSIYTATRTNLNEGKMIHIKDK